MERTPKPDLILLSLSGLLVSFGILVLASVSASFSLQKFGDTFYFLNHQIIIGLIPGLLAGAIAYLAPLEFIKKWSLAALAGTMVLLGLVFVPGIGVEAGEAHRWIALGPFSFQPSELLKIVFIVYLAAWMATHTGKRTITGGANKKNIFARVQEGKETLLPFLIICGIIGLFLILQPDIGTLGVIAATACIMYFLAKTPLWHTGVLVLGGIASLAVLIQLAPYRLSRLAVFLNPALDPLGQGYQIQQALIGIGSGGITGVGLGLSFQKFGVLPEPMGDSIFAIFAEEIGLLGATLLIILFLGFLWRSFVITGRLEDPFAKTVAAGVAVWITLQAFVNMGAMLGILPLTGIPLPFISYGGSALVAELIGIGLLLNISRIRYS